jgi:hypothetical protein
MKLVIIAGGKGSRLNLKNIPKPMVKIEGKPVLQYQVELAKKHGMEEVHILSGHLAETIVNFFSDGRKFGIKINHLTEPSPLGTAGCLKQLKNDIQKFNFKMRATKNFGEEEKYWTIRRESFNLLRKHVKGKRTAPFIDDVCVLPENLPEFLPKMRKILDETGILYTIAGHAGNGNFHIIPLMNLKDDHTRALIPILSEKIYNLVKEYNGSITAEHNDGIVRTPYLDKMYSSEILDLFQQTKYIFDPKNIFNPGKKVGGSIEYMVGHIIKN